MKFGEAYQRGKDGEPLIGSGLRIKVAHWLGALSFDRDLQQPEKDIAETFEQAIRHSRGLNKSALGILKAAGKIPHQAASSPLRGIDYPTSDGLVRRWHTNLAHRPERPEQTPVIQSLGALMRDDMTAAYVRNITISCEVPVTRLGRVKGAATTAVRLNTDEDGYANGGAFTVSSDGLVGSFAVDDQDYVYNTPEKRAFASGNVQALFDSALEAVNDTAKAYNSLDI